MKSMLRDVGVLNTWPLHPTPSFTEDSGVVGSNDVSSFRTLGPKIGLLMVGMWWVLDWLIVGNRMR